MSYDLIVSLPTAFVMYCALFYTLRKLPDIITDIVICSVVCYILLIYFVL
jgi:hypothetical protein